MLTVMQKPSQFEKDLRACDAMLVLGCNVSKPFWGLLDLIVIECSQHSDVTRA